ncbi:MAG: ribonuclease III [Bacteroidales bacterium]|nr:ribonuclease III [Clostridium sp.]MCM1202803.1 ribonuclease III [Bacteroidales bacterium]
MLNYNEEEIEKNINYTFKDKALLKQALSHSSFINEMKRSGLESYERLEFLGDAVLELIISEFLFTHDREMPEGKLTKRRASIVCEFTLSSVSEMLHLGDFVLLSKGEELTGGRNRSSILCDLFESVLGAIYLDGGMEEAKRYVDAFLLADIEHKALFYDAKTTLQEMVQKDNKGTVTYEMIEEKGPDHLKSFVMEVYVDGVSLATGEGTSKKNAQQMAAYRAILKLKEQQE